MSDGPSGSGGSAAENLEELVRLGANLGLVDEMYAAFRRDPASVDVSWRDLFAAEAGQPAAAGGNGAGRGHVGGNGNGNGNGSGGGPASLLAASSAALPAVAGAEA